MSTERKLDIFAVIAAMQRKDFEFFNNLIEQQRKEFAPIVAQRWLSGTNDPLQIVMINECVNPYVFALTKHPNLLYKLMTVATHSKSRCIYPKTKKKDGRSRPIATEVVKRFFGVSTQNASEMIDTLHVDQILEAAFDLGYETDVIKKLKKELS